MVYRFTVGRLSCAVISDGQMRPPWEPPLAAFFTPAAGVPVSHPRWCTPWDHDTARSVHTRRRLLDRAAGERLWVHAYHMPFPGLGTITRHGGAYRWQPTGV